MSSLFQALRHGGPLGLVSLSPVNMQMVLGADLAFPRASSLQLLGYAVMGSIVYSVMIALGEMVSHLPVAGGTPIFPPKPSCFAC